MLSKGSPRSVGLMASDARTAATLTAYHEAWLAFSWPGCHPTTPDNVGDLSGSLSSPCAEFEFSASVTAFYRGSRSLIIQKNVSMAQSESTRPFLDECASSR